MPSTVSPSNIVPETSFHQASILIVDDEASSCALLKHILSGNGFSQVHTVATGEAAIDFCAEQTPDFLLVDINMPGKFDGIQTVQEIHKTSKVPTAYITACVEESILQRAISTAPYGYIIKPYDRVEVLVTLRTSLFKAANERAAQQMETLRQQASKMETVGALTAGIAHDFNNILAIIHSHAEVLKMKLDSDDRRYSYVDKIYNASSKGAELVRSLMRFSRAEEISEETFSPKKAIRETVEMLQRLLTQSIQLTAHYQTELPNIHLNQNQLQQIIINICLNAKDAMQGSGNIDIFLSTVSPEEIKQFPLSDPTTPHLLIRIQDDGPGIPEEIREKIFAPFFTTKDPSSGTGLGLSTSYNTIQQAKGLLCLNNEYNKGACFDIYLPEHLISEEEPHQAPCHTISPFSENAKDSG